jgi:hypothetical protein
LFGIDGDPFGDLSHAASIPPPSKPSRCSA